MVLFIAIITTLLYSPLTSYLLKDVMTSRLEKVLDMTIVFGKTRFDFPARLTVLDVKATDKNGAALTAEWAHLQLDISKIIKANAVLSCELKNASIGSGPCNSLNSLLKPLNVPAQDIYRFENVTAMITIKKGSFEVHGLNAAGEDFRLFGEFTRFKDKKVDYNMDFRINKRVLDMEEGKESRILLNEYPPGWYSIKLSVKRGPGKSVDTFFSIGNIAGKFSKTIIKK